MYFVTIAGEQREVVLTKKDVSKFVRIFNGYYLLATQKVRRNENHYLLEIDAEKDQNKKLEMMNKLINFIEKEQEKIEFPYFIIHDIMWKILPEKEKTKFRNRFFMKSKKKMINSIRIDEYQVILDFIGSKILNLSGYNKKKTQLGEMIQ